MGAGQGPRLLRGILFADAGQRPALPEGVSLAGRDSGALLGGVLFAGASQRPAARAPKGEPAMALLMGKTCIIDHHAFIIPLFYFD